MSFRPHSVTNSSSRPHLAMVLFSLVVIVMLSFLLAVGWKKHLSDLDERVRTMQSSERIDQQAAVRAKERAAALQARARGLVTPDPVAGIMAAPTSTQLGAMAKDEQGTGFTEPQPMAESLEPERFNAAVALVNQYWRATSWESKLDLVRDRDRVRPAMHSYYVEQQGSDPQTTGEGQTTPYLYDGHQILVFQYPSPRLTGQLQLHLVARAGEPFLIDWESLVGASELSWEIFKKTKPTEPKLFRVVAKLDDYYNYEFTDHAQLMSLQLASPDGLYFVYGYCERDSPIGQSLLQLFALHPNHNMLTLRLAFPEKAQSDHCLRITGVVSNHWLMLR
jgi:hypothetical protein